MLLTVISQASFFGFLGLTEKAVLRAAAHPIHREGMEWIPDGWQRVDASQNMQKNTLLEHKLWYNTEKEQDWSD